jgi:predicted glycogen debranching enzyme
MRTTFNSAVCRNLKAALHREWLETNGLGGYAASTIIGANVRRQHGLLVVAAQTPLHRHVLLSKVDERVLCDGHESHLGTNLYPGTVFPHGFNIQTEFCPLPWPTFRYATAEFEVEKSVCLVHGRNTLVIAYRNVRSSRPLELRVRPLLAYRDHNILRQRNENVDLGVERDGDVFTIRPREALPRLHFHTRPDDIEVKGDWYYRFTYPPEQEHGPDFEEDLFTPCEFVYQLPVGRSAYIVVSTDKQPGIDAVELLATERERRQPPALADDAIRQALHTAASAFVVKRGESLTVLAGYPWHTDGARVALAALPGLLLTQGEGDAARRVLQTFAGYCDEGLLPNQFDELTGRPKYNNADAPLWFIVALWRWWKAGGGAGEVRALLATARAIVQHLRSGTRENIGAGKDGLLVAGTAGSQLTWMDVNLDGYIPTPRHGKPVELNALWYNALLMLAECEEKVAGDAAAAAALRKLADQVGASFVAAFWLPTAGYLADVVRGADQDASLRPNQILAVGLPFTPLSKAQQESVLKAVTEQLLTPYGLRTLNPGNDRYCGRYTGNRRQRDGARHQGTVWPWLIGPYCDAYLRVHGAGKNQKRDCAKLLQPLLAHLSETGTVAEIFEGSAPHSPVGCFAAAWSVGELARAYTLCAA